MVVLLLSQSIFKAKWVGIGVQSYTSSNCIRGLYASGPDSSGYAYLNAVSMGGDTVPIIRAKWKGIYFQTFISSLCLRGFSARSDTAGFIYLTAYTDSDSGDVLKSKWVGTYVQGYNAYPCWVKGFSASLDSGGVAVLSVDTTCGVNVAESEEIHQGFRLLSAGESGGGIYVRYRIPEDGEVKVRLYAASGRLVAKREAFRKGEDNEERFKVPSGVYFVVLRYRNDKVVVKVVKKGGAR